MLKTMILMLMMGASAFAAHQIEANVNNRDVEGQIRLDIGRMGNAMSNTYIGARFLNGDTNNSETAYDLDSLMEVSFMSEGMVRGVPGLKLGFGIKAEYTEIDGKRYAAIPLGAEAELRLPLYTPFPFYVGGALYYAPSVLTFKEGDGYLESRLYLAAEPIQNGRLTVGYRKIDTDLKSRSVTYNDSWYFGLRLDF